VNELLEYTGVYIVNDVFKYCAFYYHKIMHISMLTPRVGGQARGGDLTFLQKKMSNATPSGEISWTKFPTPEMKLYS
jgi:hypothetical protein